MAQFTKVPQDVFVSIKALELVLSANYPDFSFSVSVGPKRIAAYNHSRGYVVFPVSNKSEGK